ncbi:hypothetical protein AJ80_01318 [Polytolypa hystricis UAMH7299]|uniref:Uncharacterized protein n=1 Tax=Polytolypa hystricis (strain UAMH7299) TaxID=1447883 RepID=A0A2B7YZ28_POLH7|nr:hypothetical protein AJ80_01318 [Polytolypa hystricis UAMH7299]
MAIWPFGRRRKRPRKTDEDTSTVTASEIFSGQHSHGGYQTTVSSQGHMVVSGKTVRRDSKRRKHNSSESQNQTDDNSILSSIHPAFRNQAQSMAVQKSMLRQANSIDTDLSRSFAPPRSYYTDSIVQMSRHGEPPHRYPTLRAKPSRTEPNVLRRKSQRRRQNDSVREQEIKNMQTQPPGTQLWDYMRRPRDANRTFEAHASDPSFLQLTSGRNSPSELDSYAFKVTTFDALTPRPILRYVESPRYAIPDSRDLSRASTRRDKGRLTQREDFDCKTRIDNLADDMDAGALRELMERDNRRREVKRLRDQENLQRKLHRRAEREREDEHRKAIRSPLAEPASNPRVDTDIKPAASQLQDQQSPTHSWLRDPSKENLAANNKQKDASAGETFDETEVSHAHASPSVSPIENPHDSVGASRPFGSTHESASDISRTLDRETRMSDTSGKMNSSWTSFFRRGGSRFKKGLGERPKEPSEFSIPSRESFSKLNPPQQSTQPLPIPERSFLRSSTPIRGSQSKFTEHLNDFPMPPETFYHPADVSVMSEDIPTRSNRLSTGTGTGTAERYSVSIRSTVATPEPREELRASGASSPDTRPESALLAQSLASIDSEGSWLSGKPSRRLSQLVNQQRASAGSTKEKLDEYTDPMEAEERNFVNNQRLDASAAAIEEGTLHESVGKRPQLISLEGRARARSREGLLTDFSMVESEPNSAEPADSPIEIQRATSVDFGKKHARHISAGSAKLLDIPRRSSDLKGLTPGGGVFGDDVEETPNQQSS